MARTSFDGVPAAEANLWTDRVLSVPCPRCGVPAGEKCGTVGQRRQYQHGARWDAWYAANPEPALLDDSVNAKRFPPLRNGQFCLGQSWYLERGGI